MFPQQHRLRKDLDVMRTLKSKRGVFDVACGIKYFPNGTEYSRFTVVVGSKVHKSAVKRNHVRRQYREIIRLHLAQIAPGYDIALLTSKPALELDYRQKEERLLRVLGKAGLLVSNVSASPSRDVTDSGVSKDTLV